MSSVKPDLSEFDALEPARSKRCKLGRILDELDPQRAVNLQAAMLHNSIGAVGLWLRRNGLATDEKVVRRHRDGKCCCADV